MSDKRIGSWMQLFSGHAYYPMDPRTSEVNIQDIAHSLAMQCRYGGHSRDFYSVAEHSVLVSHIVPPEHALVGLMHDATEAYVSDVPRPLKVHLENFQEIEDMNWGVIAEAFDLPLELPTCIHEADRDICRTEMLHLLPPLAIPFEWPRPAPDVRIVGYGPHKAKEIFLERFNELWCERLAAKYPAVYKEAA